MIWCSIFIDCFVYQMKIEEYLNHVQQFFVSMDKHNQWMAKTKDIVNHFDDASRILETVSQQVAQCKVNAFIIGQNFSQDCLALAMKTE